MFPVMTNICPPDFCSPPRPTLPSSASSRAVFEKAFLCLPDELIEVVLRRYVEHVHPQFPIIDISALFRALDPAQETKRPSVLLWQALTAAVIPFLTDPELGIAGLVSTNTALDTFVHRTKILLEIEYEDCQTTELQAIILICWRLNRGKPDHSRRKSLLDRALQLAKEIEPIVTARQFSRPDSLTALHIRLWWSCYLLQVGLTIGEFCGSVRLEPPPGAKLLSLDDFDFGWLSSPRALEWYKFTGNHQALSRYLQLASYFCRKIETCTQIEGVKHLVGIGSYENSVRPSTGHHHLATSQNLPVSLLFWTAMDIDSKLQTVTRENFIENRLSTERDEEGLGLGFLVHTAEFFILHQALILSLLWFEKLLITSEFQQQRPTSGNAVANDLIKCKIEQIAIALSQLLETICFYRLPLLAHNTNHRILENTKSVAKFLGSTNGMDWGGLIYQKCGTRIGISLWRYEDYIVSRETSVSLIFSLGTDVDHNQSHSSSECHTTPSTPVDFDSLTSFDTKSTRWENPEAQWEIFGGELLQIADCVRLF